MTMLEQRMIPVDGATIEVFLGGTGEPVICVTHPCGVALADKMQVGAWEVGMGRIVAVNPRGVGSSTGQAPTDFTFGQHVEDLEAVRQHLGVDRWVFWGESGGGCIGLLYALAHSQGLGGAIIGFVSPSGPRVAVDPHSIFNLRHPSFQQILAQADHTGERRPATLRSLRPELAAAEWQALAEEVWVLVQGTQPLIVASGRLEERCQAMFEDFVTTFDVQDRLGEIHVPTLVVAGRMDPFFPIAQAELLRTGIPNTEFVVLEATGHGVEQQSPDFAKYRDAVRNFLARIPKRASDL